MTYKSHIPNGITSIRLILAPIFFNVLLNDLYLVSILLLTFAGLTDALDGYIARKMGLTSEIGAYLDVTSDFVLIFAGFLAYIIKGWYDPLILLLILIMFILFIGTSGLKKPVYDPVGKYLGAYLMVMLFISLLFIEPWIREILLILLVTICLASIISRFFVFFRRNKSK